MFGPLGATEILFILVLALLIFGPRRLPEVGRTVGKALGEFRRATTDLKRTVNAELALEEDDRPLPRRPSSPRSGDQAGIDDAATTVRPAVGAHPRSPLRQPTADPGVDGTPAADGEGDDPVAELRRSQRADD